jgi:hypothetical protein
VFSIRFLSTIRRTSHSSFTSIVFVNRRCRGGHPTCCCRLNHLSFGQSKELSLVATTTTHVPTICIVAVLTWENIATRAVAVHSHASKSQFSMAVQALEHQTMFVGQYGMRTIVAIMIIIAIAITLSTNISLLCKTAGEA